MLRIRREVLLAQSHSGSYPEPGRRLKAELRIGACLEAPDTSTSNGMVHGAETMRRREFIKLIGSGTVAWRTQQPEGVRRVSAIF